MIQIMARDDKEIAQELKREMDQEIAFDNHWKRVKKESSELKDFLLNNKNDPLKCGAEIVNASADVLECVKIDFQRMSNSYTDDVNAIKRILDDINTQLSIATEDSEESDIDS